MSAQAHLDKATRHSAAARAMTGNAHEWAVVAYFYAALHTLQAYLLSKGIEFPPDNHGARATAIRENSELCHGRGMAFRNAYNRLKNLSEQVRYDPTFIATTADIDTSRRDYEMASSFLTPKINVDS